MLLHGEYPGFVASRLTHVVCLTQAQREATRRSDDDDDDDDDARAGGGRGRRATEPPLEANVNRVSSDYEVASGIDAALGLLSSGGAAGERVVLGQGRGMRRLMSHPSDYGVVLAEGGDRHPERRMKAAYKVSHGEARPRVVVTAVRRP
jgi:hypothetical protein